MCGESDRQATRTPNFSPTTPVESWGLYGFDLSPLLARVEELHAEVSQPLPERIIVYVIPSVKTA
ncbi:MAG: hypothetical protein ACJARR_000545 [Pseudophaeobacter arcticus]|jgi:hypothetical protein